MNATHDLIDRVVRAGIRLSARGDKLRITTPSGLSDNLRLELAGHKPEILRAIAGADMRGHLILLAAELGIPRAIVDGLPQSEIDACVEQVADCDGFTGPDGNPISGQLLVFYLRSLAGLIEPLPGSPAHARRQRP